MYNLFLLYNNLEQPLTSSIQTAYPVRLLYEILQLNFQKTVYAQKPQTLYDTRTPCASII